MGKQSQTLEFTKVHFQIERSEDFMGTQNWTIRNMKQLRDVLNELELDDDFGLYISGETADGHRAHFRFYSHPKKDHPWYWGFVSFALDTLDSQAERLLQKVRELVR